MAATVASSGMKSFASMEPSMFAARGRILAFVGDAAKGVHSMSPEVGVAFGMKTCANQNAAAPRVNLLTRRAADGECRMNIGATSGSASAE
jgi:hypothetical protein